MPRNVRTYDHFCLLARSLERVGDRWSLLVVRDLLTGPKRFTDLMDRLGGITPKTLTQRLRELADGGVVDVERAPGRREVWYRLTAAGAELGPVIDALSWWGLRHAWRPPRPGERLHVEHLLRALVQVLERTGRHRPPLRWQLRFADAGGYVVRCDGDRWSLSAGESGAEVDVVVTVPSGVWPRYVADPSPKRARELGIELGGKPAQVARLHRLVRSFRDLVNRQAEPARSP